jgi:prolyl 4-hydroxylase
MFAKVGDEFSTTDVSKEGSELTLTLECISERPLIFKATNVMSATECAHIVQRATDKLEKSFVMGGAGAGPAAAAEGEVGVAGETVFSSVKGSYNSGGASDGEGEMYRSSYNAWLHADEVATALQCRFAAATGLPLQLFQQKSEELQVVKYKVGGQFKVHHDSSAFQPRLLTALLYLNNVLPEHGGGTWFPFAGADPAHGPESVESAIKTALPWGKFPPSDRPGVTVTPSQGDAIIFFNHLRNGELDPLAVHAGLPILSDEKHDEKIQGGGRSESSEGHQVDETSESTLQKWIANYWVEYDERILFE